MHYRGSAQQELKVIENRPLKSRKWRPTGTEAQQELKVIENRPLKSLKWRKVAKSGKRRSIARRKM